MKVVIVLSPDDSKRLRKLLKRWNVRAVALVVEVRNVQHTGPLVRFYKAQKLPIPAEILMAGEA